MSFFKLFLANDDATPKARAVWRQWIGVGMVGIWIFAWWAVGVFGELPFIGSGFAKAETVNSVRVELIRTNLLQNRIRHCKATTDESRAYLIEIIQRQILEYEKLTGNRYVLPTCEDLAGIAQ